MALLTRRFTNSSASATPSTPKALQRLQNCIAFLWPSLQPTPSNRTTAAAIDVIDSFTNELVTRKAKKWENMRDNLVKSAEVGNTTTTNFKQTVGMMAKSVITEFEAAQAPELGLDIRTLSQPQLDNLLLSTLEIKNKVDFLYLIKQCIAWQQLPSDQVLIACLKYLSSLTMLQHIDSFIKILKLLKNPLLTTYAGLAPFKAMAQWHNGNADMALATLSRAYASSVDYADGRRMMRAAFRTITEETLSKKSEAVLVALLDVARDIYTEHKDIFVLACIWKQCFLSEWFCDQKSATLLFDKYEDLQSLIGRKSSFLCSSFLRQNNVDAVHRLVEAFLQYKQREACSNCLSVLFDYQYHRTDLRACAEIIKSCSELDMPLSEFQNEQFLSLFLNQTEPKFTPISTHKLRTPLHEFQYKF